MPRDTSRSRLLFVAAAAGDQASIKRRCNRTAARGLTGTEVPRLPAGDTQRQRRRNPLSQCERVDRKLQILSVVRSRWWSLAIDSLSRVFMGVNRRFPLLVGYQCTLRAPAVGTRCATNGLGRPNCAPCKKGPPRIRAVPRICLHSSLSGYTRLMSAASESGVTGQGERRSGRNRAADGRNAGPREALGGEQHVHESFARRHRHPRFPAGGSPFGKRAWLRGR